MGQVSLRAIRKSYESIEVIRGIDFDVVEGEFLVFVGPSGCGKSTTLRMIAGLESISSGDLLIDGVRANDIALPTGVPPWCSKATRYTPT